MSFPKKRLRFIIFAAFGISSVAGLLLVSGRHTTSAAAGLALQGDDPRLAGAYRFDRGGWSYVHLQGTPEQIGYQHGYLLAPEIADAFQTIRVESTHDSKRDWEFFRRAAIGMLWPKIDPEYQMELQGIVSGLEAQRVKLDLGDIVAMNAFEELPAYYVPWLNAQQKAAGITPPPRQDHCSAFVATGSWTRDRGIVMAHNDWTNYATGERWRVIFDIVPQKGHRMFMDGTPGVIASDDDFGVNSDGLMVTETTISEFHGWDPSGKPEFVRARKALQYAGSIDEFEKIMLDGNNGGYANDWLLGDRKTGEIAQLELGLKHTPLWRTTDGYFAGSNFASNPKVIADETTYDPNNPELSPNARRDRWDQLLEANRGKIDVSLAQVFLADHYDSFTKKMGADQRTLCGHADAATAPDSKWPRGAYGAVQGKVTDSRMAQAMSFIARAGHPCGANFNAADYLASHPEDSWESAVLRDMVAGPWTEFHAGEQPAQ